MQNDWRVVGLWRGGRTFLIVTGTSHKRCVKDLVGAMADYDQEDFDRIESIWSERWDPGTSLRAPAWIPFEEIPIGRLLVRRAMCGAPSRRTFRPAFQAAPGETEPRRTNDENGTRSCNLGAGKSQREP